MSKIKNEEVGDPWVPSTILPSQHDLSDIYGLVWETLSAVDVSEHTQEKNGLTYLSWAWGVLMEHYPEAEFQFSEEKFFPDGSCQVECELSIRGASRKMWTSDGLPK